MNNPSPNSTSQAVSTQASSSRKSGWHAYRESLIAAGIKQKTHSWYARHAERYVFTPYEALFQ
jgi:hypothetical protein